MRLSWVASAGLGACGAPLSDESAFDAEFAARWCERQEECARGEFEREYDTRDECRADQADHPDLPHADEDCALDPDGAADCLDYLRTTDCAGWEGKSIDDACEDAHDC